MKRWRKIIFLMINKNMIMIINWNYILIYLYIDFNVQYNNIILPLICYWVWLLFFWSPMLLCFSYRYVVFVQGKHTHTHKHIQGPQKWWSDVFLLLLLLLSQSIISFFYSTKKERKKKANCDILKLKELSSYLNK